jgi:hypothetical protein
LLFWEQVLRQPPPAVRPAAYLPLSKIRVVRAQDGAYESLVLEAGRYCLKTADVRDHSIDATALAGTVKITGPWEVQFTPGRGAPPSIHLPKLISCSDHSDAGVRHFSGKATYRKTISVPTALLQAGSVLLLDSGKVHVIAPD